MVRRHADDSTTGIIDIRRWFRSQAVATEGDELMSWNKQEVLAYLKERPRVGRLATVTPGGAPRVVPVWFRTRDDKVLVHTGARMAKARNIEATGQYALAVDDDAWPYRGVSVWGPARLLDPEAAVGGDLRSFMT